MNRNLSLMTALVRFAYTAFLGLALVHLFRIIPFIRGAETTVAETAGQQILKLAGTFSGIWSPGLFSREVSVRWQPWKKSSVCPWPWGRSCSPSG